MNLITLFLSNCWKLFSEWLNQDRPDCMDSAWLARLKAKNLPR